MINRASIVGVSMIVTRPVLYAWWKRFILDMLRVSPMKRYSVVASFTIASSEHYCVGDILGFSGPIVEGTCIVVKSIPGKELQVISVNISLNSVSVPSANDFLGRSIFVKCNGRFNDAMTKREVSAEHFSARKKRRMSL